MELLRARFGVELPVHLQRTSGLFWRAVLAFLALPTVVAGVVPFDRCTGFL